MLSDNLWYSSGVWQSWHPVYSHPSKMDWSSRTIWNTLDSQTQNIFMKIYLWSLICINIKIICNCHLAKMALKADGIEYFLFVTKFVLSLKYNAARKWDFFALTNCCSWKYDACSQMRSGLQLSLTIYSQGHSNIQKWLMFLPWKNEGGICQCQMFNIC